MYSRHRRMSVRKIPVGYAALARGARFGPETASYGYAGMHMTSPFGLANDIVVHPEFVRLLPYLLVRIASDCGTGTAGRWYHPPTCPYKLTVPHEKYPISLTAGSDINHGNMTAPISLLHTFPLRRRPKVDSVISSPQSLAVVKVKQERVGVASREQRIVECSR